MQESKVLTKKDLALLGGVSVGSLNLSVQRGKFPRPERIVWTEGPNRKRVAVWTDTPELRQLVEQLFQPQLRQVDTEGMITTAELSRRTGMPVRLLHKYVRKGLVSPDTPARGTHRQGLFRPTPELLAALRKAAEHIAAGGTYLDLPEEVKGVMKSRAQEVLK